MQKRRILIAEQDGLVAELRQGPELATTLPRHFHEEFQIILGEHRVIRYGMRGQSMICPTGAVVLIPPGEVHTAAVVPSAGMWGDLRTFLVPEISFASLGESGSGRDILSPLGEAIRFDPLLLGLLSDAHRALQDRSRAALERDCFVLRALAGLVSMDGPRARCKVPGPCSRRLLRARDFLREHPHRNVRLKEVASAADLSPFHLARTFREHFGLSVHSYHLNVRVGKARKLLVSGIAAAEVAQQTGFADQAHLTRTFHSIVGVTPARYLRIAGFFKTRERKEHQTDGICSPYIR
jgi:AraC-like DNA-binding protein